LFWSMRSPRSSATRRCLTDYPNASIASALGLFHANLTLEAKPCRLHLHRDYDNAVSDLESKALSIPRERDSPYLHRAGLR
jgi:hypothetical protein